MSNFRWKLIDFLLEPVVLVVSILKLSSCLIRTDGEFAKIGEILIFKRLISQRTNVYHIPMHTVQVKK